jgi:hypothetical protein
MHSTNTERESNNFVDAVQVGSIEKYQRPGFKVKIPTKLTA